jgi:hypothetical protein
MADKLVNELVKAVRRQGREVRPTTKWLVPVCWSTWCEGWVDMTFRTLALVTVSLPVAEA